MRMISRGENGARYWRCCTFILICLGIVMIQGLIGLAEGLPTQMIAFVVFVTVLTRALTTLI